jgi:CheY-like chemotaxis protein
VKEPDTMADESIQRVIGLEPGHPRYRMLIVDDKWDNRQLLIKLLEPFGFDLREAENGREAVDICDAWQPHLIWMDMRMPVMDGYEATQKIRTRINRSRETTIIAVTANVLEDEKTKVISSGCDDIVIKPFKEADIIELIQKHLEVKFIYASEDAYIDEVNPKSDSQKLSHGDFAGIPEEIIVKLKKSVDALEMDTALAVIEQFRERNPSLANEVRKLVKQYRFDTLQKLLNKG